MEIPDVDRERWYAVWTRSRHEGVVRSQLVEKSLQVFLPGVSKWSRRKDRKKRIEKPLFPGYLFVRALLEPRIRLEIMKCQGVVDILGYVKGEASPVPDEEIDSIKLLLSSKTEIREHPYLRVGELVKVVSGPFDGVVGRIIELRGRRRLVVSVDVLQKSIFVVLEKGRVIPYQSVSTPLQENG